MEKILEVASLLIAKEEEEEAGVSAASQECRGLRGLGFMQCIWGDLISFFLNHSFSQHLLCPTVCQALS